MLISVLAVAELMRQLLSQLGTESSIPERKILDSENPDPISVEPGNIEPHDVGPQEVEPQNSTSSPSTPQRNSKSLEGQTPSQTVQAPADLADSCSLRELIPTPDHMSDLVNDSHTISVPRSHSPSTLLPDEMLSLNDWLHPDNGSNNWLDILNADASDLEIVSGGSSGSEVNWPPLSGSGSSESAVMSGLPDDSTPSYPPLASLHNQASVEEPSRSLPSRDNNSQQHIDDPTVSHSVTSPVLSDSETVPPPELNALAYLVGQKVHSDSASQSYSSGESLVQTSLVNSHGLGNQHTDPSSLSGIDSFVDPPSETIS